MRFRLIIVLVLAVQLLQGQNIIDSLSVNDNPYTAVYNHLFYLQSDSYIPEQAAFSFPEELRADTDLAIKLKQVLDGKGMFVDLNRVPKDNNYIDSTTLESIYFIDRDEQFIYLERIDGKWYYSRTTLSEVPVMHEKLYPFGTRFMTMFEAPTWQYRVLGIKLWKLLGLLLLLVITVILFSLLNLIFKKLLGGIVQKRIEVSEQVQTPLEKLSRLFGLLLAIRFLLYFFPMFQLDPRLTSVLLKALNILSIFFIILVIQNIIRIFFVYLDRVAKKTENTLDDQLLPVLMKLSMIIIWSLGIIYILDYLDVNVTALLAGISIGGLALALAAQDTVKNFFGSIMIFLDKPFQIGDWIHFKDVDGTVEEVGVRSTRIRTFANSITYVPNALLADSIIDNMGLRIYRRFHTNIGITYDTPPEIINVFVKGIREIIRMHPTTRKDYYEVHLNSFGDSSLNIIIYMFFEAPTWTDELRAKHDILYAIIKLAEKIGVRFAFPTQTLHIEELPLQGGSNTPPYQSPEAGQNNLHEVLEEIQKYFKSDKGHTEKFKPLGGE
ncbi:MAG: mechanosensitive ion channel family protein [Saprospiraceae bacterium]|nr:mechanosensitive ion channel family protein [Saprospiraceae bacterium]